MTIASPPSALEAGLRRIDEIADRTFAGWHVPGVAYGVVLDGALIHSRGLGTLRVGEDATPARDSVFRIASMTKSFTAAAVMLLRDEGRLRLDDLVELYVPELAYLRYPTTDSPRISIRHLLSMSAGFATDDPWGDRQQGLDLARFSELLRGGISVMWPPGVRYEYSNLGYGILGRLITNVCGREYRDMVRDRLLDPLRMDSTGYLEAEVDPARLAHGYVWRDGAYLEEPIDGYGALAAMGGIFTTVEDLARWVAEFTDAWPARDDPEGTHPLRRATRREMQQASVPAGMVATHASTDAMPMAVSEGYGFGLYVVDHIELGRIITHSGGYPGFGSNMRWHPASGLGIIVLANGRYAPATLLGRELLDDLIRAEAAPIRRTRPSRATEAARDAIETLIDRWDDAAAAALFAMNVELDQPLSERKSFVDNLRERHGALRRDETEPAISLTPSHLAWWLAGERGRVRVEISLSPELLPKVQTFALTSVPDPPRALQEAAGRLIAALEPPEPPERGPVSVDWPRDLAVAADVDLGAVVRAMRATEARFGPVRLGRTYAGDGETRATWRLESPRGRLDLALELDPVAGCLSKVAFVPARMVPPDPA